MTLTTTGVLRFQAVQGKQGLLPGNQVLGIYVDGVDRCCLQRHAHARCSSGRTSPRGVGLDPHGYAEGMSEQPTPAWIPVPDERRARIEAAMVAAGTFDRAARMLDDIDAGRVPVGQGVLDIDDLRARFA